MRIVQLPVSVREIIRPLGRMVIFVIGAGAVFSAAMILLALIFTGSPADKMLIENQEIGLLGYTISILPQVLIDGVTLGFVYAAIALGYTMVYGVLEFINFAHSEIFAIGAFAGVEFLLFMERLGILAGASVLFAYVLLIMAVLAGMMASGTMAVVV